MYTQEPTKKQRIDSVDGYILKDKKGYYLKKLSPIELTMDTQEALFFKNEPRFLEKGFRTVPVTKEIYQVTRINRRHIREYVLVDLDLTLKYQKPIFRGTYTDHHMPRLYGGATDNPLNCEKYAKFELVSYDVWDGVSEFKSSEFYTKLINIPQLEKLLELRSARKLETI